MRPFLLATAFAVPALVASVAYAQAAPAYNTPAAYAYMKDLSSGQVLYSKDADKPMPPASMGKMMTVYVAFQMIKNGEARLDQKIMVTPETWKQWHSQGSTMFLSVNEQVSVENLLHGIVTLSGNDACVTLGKGLGGTEENYVALMNRTAQKLGMKGSHFSNTNGWPDPNEYVTAHDLALVAEATIRDFPDLYKRFYATPNFTWGKTLGAGADIKQDNRNPILGKVPGADGLKTGHTDEAGYGFTGSAEQNGRRIVMVLAGMSSWNERVSSSIDFMNWGFAAWQGIPLLKAGQSPGTAKVWLGTADTVPLVAPRNYGLTIPRGFGSDRSVKISYKGPVAAPITKGQHIADLVVTVKGLPETRLPLVAGAEVAKTGLFGQAWAKMKNLVGL